MCARAQVDSTRHSSDIQKCLSDLCVAASQLLLQGACDATVGTQPAHDALVAVSQLADAETQLCAAAADAAKLCALRMRMRMRKLKRKPVPLYPKASFRGALD